MKTVTTVTIALILSFTMLVTGESFQLYLSDFETEFTSVTFYPDAQEGNSAQQMVKDIEHAGQKHNVEVFVAEKNTRSMLENGFPENRFLKRYWRLTIALNLLQRL